MDSTPTDARRFAIVGVLSSAARMPLPGATSARAVSGIALVRHLLDLLRFGSQISSGTIWIAPDGHSDTQRPQPLQ